MKKTLLRLICLVLTSALFANGAGEDEGYTFATNANWPPLEYVDENGDIVGFEIDLINAMSEVSGVPMDYVNTSWDTIFAGLATASMTRSPAASPSPRRGSSQSTSPRRSTR